MKGIMFQGTASDVGKSVIVTAICRILADRGYKVTPFKSQNMSNNSYVTKDGKEIGRAQGIQAEAARVEANVYMNPILLKPRSDQISEIVRLGVVYQTLSGKNYRETFYETGIETIKEALEKLSQDFDYVVIEGAGSPVEVNLNDRELVNMKVAELADVPVVLIADIDRGGVFASIVGTLALLSEEERKRVCGIIINKFRGDERLFANGIEWIENYTGVKVLGVVPHIKGITVEGEDSLSMQRQFANSQAKQDELIDIAVINLPYVSNYTDLEPFRFEEDINIRFVNNRDEFGNPDAVIIPGTKSTFHDLNFIKNQGLDEKLVSFVKKGGQLIGLCGGYQMLGEALVDEAGSDTGIEGQEIEGLKLAPLLTYFCDKKTTLQSVGVLAEEIKGVSEEITGYEIHLGKTKPLKDGVKPFLIVNGEQEGVNLNNGQIIGTYFHHVFHNDEWRTYWLNLLREKRFLPKQQPRYLKRERDESYNQVAKAVEKALDMDKLLSVIEEWKKSNVTS